MDCTIKYQPYRGYEMIGAFALLVSSIFLLQRRGKKARQIHSNASLKELALRALRMNDHIDARVRSILSQHTLTSMISPSIISVRPTPGQKRILVTGGAGFVGSHLVDALMHKGHHVIVLDNLFTGRRSNVQHWENHPNFAFMRHDVVEPIYLEIDQIFHLACPASPPHYQYNPIKTIKTSVLGTLNMLGLAKRIRARILITSTSEIYGDPEVHPQDETYWGNVNPVGPRSCYDEGKRMSETMMYAYTKQHAIDGRIARIFNTYGPRMHPNDGRVVSNFIIQALQNKPLTIYGNGTQTRSFQYIDDLVTGLILLMESEYTSPVNLGNPQEFQVKELAEIVKEKTSSSSPIDFLPPTEDDPTRRRPSISVAKQELGWTPTVSLMDGLDKTIAYFSKELLSFGGDIIPTGNEPTRPNCGM